MLRRDERWAPYGMGLLSAIPFLVSRYPPMGDLAFHEAAVSLLRHHGDANFANPELYSLNVFEPNQLFHLLALPLAFVMPTDWACKLVVAGIAFGLSVAAGRLASHLGVTRWGAALVAPLAFGWMTRWGLVANLLGFTLLLACLPTFDRGARAPSLPRALGGMGLVGLVYLAHESSMLLLAMAVVFFAWRAPRRAEQLALALLPALLAAVLAAVYHLRSVTLKAPSVDGTTAIDVSLLDRALDAPHALYSVGTTSLPLLLGSVLGVTLLVALSRAARSTWRKEVRGRAPFLLLGLASLAAYLVVPEALFGSTLVYQRFLPLAFALIVLTLAPSAGSRVAPLLLLLLLAMIVRTHGMFVVADRDYRDLDVVLLQMQDGAAVAQLDLNPREPSKIAPVVGGAARALAVHGGRMLFSFTDAPTYPVTMPPLRRWDEPVKRMVMTPFAFAPAYDLTRFRYVLARVATPKMQATLVQAFAPEAKLIANRGSWMLFESLLPLDPITADDRGLPSPAPMPLATRVNALLGRQQ